MTELDKYCQSTMLYFFFYENEKLAYTKNLFLHFGLSDGTGVKNPSANSEDTSFDPWVGKIP